MKLNILKSVVLVSIATGVMVSSLAIAGVGKVANTKHNFAIGGGTGVYQSTTTSELCVFCHTPHNAGQTRALWNKASLTDPTKTSANNYGFRLYTSSPTLTNTTRTQSTLPAGSPSLLCLSCHDGKTAMNVLHNSGSVGASADASAAYPAGSTYIQTAAGFAPVVMPGPAWNFFTSSYDPSMNLGRASDGSNDTQGNNLTDDHPIGFSYSAVYGERATGLQTLVSAQGKGIRFYTAANRVECSSCHDPHVDYSAAGNPLLKPFLVMDNSGSKLCLACHNK